MSVSADIRRRYAWHRGQGERAGYALDSARAESLLEDAIDLGVASVEWLDDPEPYDPGNITGAESETAFQSGRWTGPYGLVVRAGDAEASLWSIVLGAGDIAGDPYARVLVSELAADILDDIRQAVGDARDADLYQCEGWPCWRR